MGVKLGSCAPLSCCLYVLSQLLVSEEELIAPKPRTPEPREQEVKREMLEFVTVTTLEQTYEALDGGEGEGTGHGPAWCWGGMPAGQEQLQALGTSRSSMTVGKDP